MAILDNAIRTSSSPARAVLAGSVCHPDLDTDCHAHPELVEWVVELLAMTVIHFGRVREHNLFRENDGINGVHLKTVNNLSGNYSYLLVRMCGRSDHQNDR
ncbi:MAG: hypothetical protein IIC28_04125 [Chloroflexi bacterium]|nr:hypothetical protein [Chloroflexota bacterium]